MVDSVLRMLCHTQSPEVIYCPHEGSEALCSKASDRLAQDPYPRSDVSQFHRGRGEGQVDRRSAAQEENLQGRREGQQVLQTSKTQNYQQGDNPRGEEGCSI